MGPCRCVPVLLCLFSLVHAHEIALCLDLASATNTVLGLAPAVHDVAMLGENKCVFIDPCQHKTRSQVSVPVETWVHVSQLGLGTNNTDPHNNLYNMEYARVPQGILLETCQPDFSWYRQHGLWRCNQDKTTSVAVRGVCPGTEAHTLLDCIHPVQFDAQSVSLPKHPFPGSVWGSLATTCTGSVSPMTDTLCQQLRDSVDLVTYQAAALGSTQLVRYSFQEPWGCHAQTDLPAWQQASLSTPNRALDCEPVPGGVFVKSDVACHFACDVNHTLSNGQCARSCNALTAEHCELKYYAAETCSNAGYTHFRCLPCAYAVGREALPWSAGSPASCTSRACPAGTQGVNGTCTPCALNTQSASGSAQCAPCAHGTFSTEGSAVCQACFVTGPVLACGDGEQAFSDVAAIDRYFALYPDDKYAIGHHNHMYEFCHAGGKCLPCQPGHYEHHQECVPCPFAEYQPHFKNTQCFQCSYGQNTSRTGAETESECRCQGGFE